MAKCTYNFIIRPGKDEVTLSLALDEAQETGTLTEEVLLAISQDATTWKSIVSEIVRSKSELIKDSKGISYNYLSTKHTGVTANSTIKALLEQFPEVSFNDSVDPDTAVLIIDNFLKKAGTKFGKLVKASGLVIYIINGSRTLVYNLALQLNYEAALKSKQFLDFASPELDLILETYNKTKRKKATREDLLLAFYENDERFRDMQIEGVTNPYRILSDISRDLLLLNTRQSFDDPILDRVSVQMRYSVQYDKRTKLTKISPYLKASEFISIINSRLLTPVLTIAELRNLEHLGTLEAFVNALLTSEDSTFPFTITKIEDNLILFKRKALTIENVYSIGWNQFNEFEQIEPTFPTDYKIYRHKGYYYVGLYDVTPSSFGRHFKSQEEAESAIKAIVPRVGENFIDLHLNGKGSSMITSYKYMPELSYIEVLDIDINPNTKLNSEFARLLESRNFSIQDVLSIIGTLFIYSSNDADKNAVLIDLLQNTITNVDEASVLMYLLSANVSGDPLTILENALNTVQEAKSRPKRKYIISSVQSSSNYAFSIGNSEFSKLYLYEVREVSLDTDITLPSRKSSIRLAIDGVALKLNKKFKIPVHVVDNTQIKSMKGIRNDAKAFIQGDNIFINIDQASPSDLFHEYTHLVLGYLKTTPEMRRNYEELISLVAQTLKGRAKMNKLALLYSDLSEISLAEEAFVALYVEHLFFAGSDPEGIFNDSVDGLIELATKSIFDTLDEEESLASIYGKTASSIFTKFTLDIIAHNGEMSFENTALYRAIDNYISEQIKSGEIDEKCK